MTLRDLRLKAKSTQHHCDKCRELADKIVELEMELMDAKRGRAADQQRRAQRGI